MKPLLKLFCGDAVQVMRSFDAGSVNCCVTSPPYFGLRDYHIDGQIGLEGSPENYVAKLVEVFRNVRRVMADDGTLWLNLGDSYTRNPSKGGSGPSGKHDSIPSYGDARKHLADSAKIGSSDGAVGRAKRPGTRAGGLGDKQLIGIPWRVAFALQADGWILRQDIIWHKPNPMPESVKDRCTKAHEYLFLFSKSPRYFFDSEAIQEPAAYAGQMRGGSTKRYEQNAAGMDSKVYDKRNKRSVWTVKPQPYKEAHFATFPPKLIEPCILAGCPKGGAVLDPFCGSGTTGQVALQYDRRFIGIDLNPDYLQLTRKRLAGIALEVTT